MLNTTLCYVTRGDEVLMLHRVKKKNDLNQDKWIGIGGKFEGEETPDECLLREAREETGLTLTIARSVSAMATSARCCSMKKLVASHSSLATNPSRQQKALSASR